MVNRVLLVLILILSVIGCRSKKSLYEKQLVGAEIEKIEVVEQKVEKVERKDSIIEKKQQAEHQHTNTKLHVEFDPKKNDSLEVSHAFGQDSLRLKIAGMVS